MSLVGFKAQNHPQQATSDDVDDRATTWDVFSPLHTYYGFTVDVAAAAHNTKLPKFYDRDADGLAQDWSGEHVWCNPPYSAIAPWVVKAWAEVACPLIVMLLPANRTEQVWWQEHVEPYRDQSTPLRSEFWPGRVRFLRPGQTTIGANERPPFGMVLLVWDRTGRYPRPPAAQQPLFEIGGVQ